MSEQTMPGPGAEAVAAFDKRFADGGYQYGQGAKDQARGWFCHGYAAAAGPPRDHRQLIERLLATGHANKCASQERRDPHACDCGYSLRLDAAAALAAAPPAASAAPKEGKGADQMYGENKRAMDRERMGRHETTAEDLIDPPTPDDGRSDAEWSDSVCDQLIADAVPGWNREFLVNDFRRVVRRVAQFSAKHGKRIAETPAKTGGGR